MVDKDAEKRRKRRDRAMERYREYLMEYLEAREAGEKLKAGELIHGLCMFGIALQLADPNGHWVKRMNAVWEECTKEMERRKTEREA